MLRYMLDTKLCIRVLRDRPAGLRDRFNRAADALCISTIVLTEQLVGAEDVAVPTLRANFGTRPESPRQSRVRTDFGPPTRRHTVASTEVPLA
jgi:predicted nucleic acid-binding protein